MTTHKRAIALKLFNIEYEYIKNKFLVQSQGVRHFGLKRKYQCVKRNIFRVEIKMWAFPYLISFVFLRNTGFPPEF